MKSCIIYKSDIEFIIVTQCMTDVWIVVDCEPIYRLPVNNDEEEFLLKIIHCIDSSRQDVPRPPREELVVIQKNNLTKMGFNSYSALYKKTKCCKLEFIDGVYKITPYGYLEEGKPSKGLKQLENETVHLKEKKELVSNIKSILS